MANIQELFRSAVRPLPPIHDASFAQHFDSYASKRLVLLGDGSHGTSEFYSARAAITKRLVEHHGFTMLALEADWPDAEAIDRYVRQLPGPKAQIGEHTHEGNRTYTFEPFKRFPTWMWRNREMQELVEWLRNHNAGLPDHAKVGIYGLDLYSMGESIRAVTNYLDRVDPAMAREARKRYSCLEPWVEEPQEYGLAVLRGMQDCESAVVTMLRDLLARRLEFSRLPGDGEAFHSSEQNAYLVRDAERYYKAMYYSSAGSWTLRDSHMVDTLRRLLRFRAAAGDGKAVVWAHNSHCGDARYTSMGLRRREVNIGQLCREVFGHDQVALLGCGTHTGTVAAASAWDGDMQVMDVRPSRRDSWERLAHDTGIDSFLLDLREEALATEVQEALGDEYNRLQRFIGVIYRPDTERISHYSEADLLHQFDGYVWFDRTSAVHPLEVVQPVTPLGREETYPFGL